MPTYEYACTRCGQHIEVVQSMSDARLTECGACGGTLRKVFAPIGIVFKGSGFYRTDSRSKSSKKEGAGAATKESATKDGATKDGGTKDGATKAPASSSSETSSSKKSEKSA